MQSIVSSTEKLWRDTEVAQFCGVSVATVRRWRMQRRGPAWIKCGGGAVRYRPENVRTFLDDCTIEPQKEMGEGR